MSKSFLQVLRQFSTQCKMNNLDVPGSISISKRTAIAIYPDLKMMLKYQTNRSADAHVCTFIGIDLIAPESFDWDIGDEK